MPMTDATPAYATKQMLHSVEMLLLVHSKGIDDGHGDLEQAKLERSIGQNSPDTKTQRPQKAENPCMS